MNNTLAVIWKLVRPIWKFQINGITILNPTCPIHVYLSTTASKQLFIILLLIFPWEKSCKSWHCGAICCLSEEKKRKSLSNQRLSLIQIGLLVANIFIRDSFDRKFLDQATRIYNLSVIFLPLPWLFLHWLKPASWDSEEVWSISWEMVMVLWNNGQ